MSKIGGYQIIDFGGVDLDNITEPTTIYLKTSTKGLLSFKRVVLSGLIYGGYKLNDFEVILHRGESEDFLTTSVLGYTITFAVPLNHCLIEKEAEPEPEPEPEPKPEPAPSPIKYFYIDGGGYFTGGHTQGSLAESIQNNPETEHIVVQTDDNVTRYYRLINSILITGVVTATQYVFMSTEITVMGSSRGEISERYFAVMPSDINNKVNIENITRETT